MKNFDCERARELLIEADLSELHGGNSPLALHLRHCDACHAEAQRILRGYRELDAGLAAFTRSQRRARTRWARLVPMPVAAAALLTLFLVRMQDRTVPEPTALATLMFRERPVASPPAGKQAIVIDNDDMVVVWLY